MPDLPRIGTPYEVWTYAIRTLTGFTGTPRTDLVGLDEAIYTRLDVAVSTRSSHTASDVWGVVTRTLTGFTGRPRIDLLGEDADFEAGIGARKVRIDRLADMEAHRPPIEGTASFFTTDVYPKTVTLIDTTTLTDVVDKQHLVDGFIDLTNNVVGETIRVIEYMIIKSGGAFIKYAQEDYTGVQDLPLLHVTTKPARYGLKVDLYMETAPTADRYYDYQLFVKVIE